MEKILITPRSYGKYDPSVEDLLTQAGYTLVRNPVGRILTKEEMMQAIAGCSGVIIGVDPLDTDVLRCAPNLRAVSKYGVGTDNIDLDYCKAHDIAVSITRGANAQAVADYAFSLLCACARKIPLINSCCHERDWTKRMGLDIYGKKLGILGLGAIGKGVAERATGFHMEVLAYDLYWDEAYANAHGIRFAQPDEIFSVCDFISLHLPLTEQTRYLVDAAALARMKPECVLINTARGELIDETALVRALKNHSIAAAGLDVFREEPPENPALYELDNLIMGAHCAASTPGASMAMSRMATENLLQNLNPSKERCDGSSRNL